MKLLGFSPNLFINRRKIIAGGLIAFISGVLLGGILLNFSPFSPFFSASGQPLATFSSYEDLVKFVNTSTSNSYYYLEDARMWTLGATGDGTVPKYSTTNIQVEGVDEADIVKTDGKYLYVISNQTVFIINASLPEEMTIASQIKLNQTLYGIFINGDKLAVFGSSPYETPAELAYRSYYWPYSTPKTFIKVYDVSNRTSPVSTRNVTIDGSYFNSRMIGNHVYAVTNEPAWLNETEVKLPTIRNNEGVHEILATDVHYSNITDYGYAFTTIIAVNVQNDAEIPTHKTILMGATRSMYVSLNNVYITLSGQPDITSETETTMVYRIQIKAGNIDSQAAGAVPGRVLDQFSMDEHNEYFRIATTTGSLWGGKSQNHVYVLNMSLGIVGRLEGLAPGERIYSARFMGNKFYLVTFRKVDPLFVIDLQDPKDPTVLGELKITGYSDYLHPYDEDHVIGIGKETEAAISGDFSWYQGVKISLFDVSDPLKPQELDKDEIGDRGTDSPVLTNHKAFLFDKEKQLLVIPVLVAEVDETKYPGEPPANTHGDYIWQGAYIYNITLEGLELRGNITHIEAGYDLQSSYYSYSPYAIKRSLYIDNVLYTISDKKIKMNNLDSLDLIGEIELP